MPDPDDVKFLRYHQGVDFGSHDATGAVVPMPFQAGVAGTVTQAGSGPYKLIEVELANGNRLRYLHASSMAPGLRVGSKVEPGTVLGTTGGTSPGGSVSAGLAIYDTMQFVTCDVNTYCMGIAASMGAVLLCAGTKGKRYALPNSDIMIHQVSGGAHGQASDVERQVEFMFKLKKRLNRILALHTGQPVEVIEKDADRDYYMTAEEAKTYGLVDEVVKSRKDIKDSVETTKESE